jgi:pantoate--beta-alanine ligase
MSSRNERLTLEERNQASVIYQTLLQAKVLFQNETIESAIQLVQQTFENHPLFDLEYFVIADEETLLSSITKEKNKNYRAFIAVFVNNIRLIDTISLN